MALCRWPTTIGGWKTFEKSDGTMALKYKESVTGDALWPEVLATPTWHPAPGMPTRKLLIKRGDTLGAQDARSSAPGTARPTAWWRSSTTRLVDTEHGEPELMDLRIRTHGTPGYRSVKRGESNGCHRLHNYLALRLAGFLVRHRHVRDGLVRESYVQPSPRRARKSPWPEDSGYRFELTPPVPVTVLDGDVRGSRRAVERDVPLDPPVPRPAPPAGQPGRPDDRTPFRGARRLITTGRCTWTGLRRAPAGLPSPTGERERVRGAVGWVASDGGAAAPPSPGLRRRGRPLPGGRGDRIFECGRLV